MLATAKPSPDPAFIFDRYDRMGLFLIALIVAAPVAFPEAAVLVGASLAVVVLGLLLGLGWAAVFAGIWCGVFGLGALADAELTEWTRFAALALVVFHPPHEQTLGFREQFNRAVLGLRHWYGAGDGPLGPTRNALQAVLLTVGWAAAVLWGGPYLVAVWAALSFYVGDYWLTHNIEGLAGGWSALGAVGALSVHLAVSGYAALPWGLYDILFTLLAALAGGIFGFLALLQAWYLADRRVIREARGR